MFWPQFLLLITSCLPPFALSRKRSAFEESLWKDESSEQTLKALQSHLVCLSSPSGQWQPAMPSLTIVLSNWFQANNCSSLCINAVYHSICQCLGQPWTPEIIGQHLDKQRIILVSVYVKCNTRVLCVRQTRTNKITHLWVMLHGLTTS